MLCIKQIGVICDFMKTIETASKKDSVVYIEKVIEALPLLLQDSQAVQESAVLKDLNMFSLPLMQRDGLPFSFGNTDELMSDYFINYFAKAQSGEAVQSSKELLFKFEFSGDTTMIDPVFHHCSGNRLTEVSYVDISSVLSPKTFKISDAELSCTFGTRLKSARGVSMPFDNSKAKKDLDCLLKKNNFVVCIVSDSERPEETVGIILMPNVHFVDFATNDMLTSELAVTQVYLSFIHYGTCYKEKICKNELMLNPNSLSYYNSQEYIRNWVGTKLLRYYFENRGMY